MELFSDPNTFALPNENEEGTRTATASAAKAVPKFPAGRRRWVCQRVVPLTSIRMEKMSGMPRRWSLPPGGESSDLGDTNNTGEAEFMDHNCCPVKLPGHPSFNFPMGKPVFYQRLLIL